MKKKYKQTIHSLEHAIMDTFLKRSILEDAGCKDQFTDSQGDGRTVYICDRKPRDMKQAFIEWEIIE